MVFVVLYLFVSVTLCTGVVTRHQNRKKMFSAFRYELVGPTHWDSHAAERQVKDYVEGVGCLGWIQQTAKKTLVGEVRCPVRIFDEVKTWFEDPSSHISLTRSHLKLYESPDMKFLFSKFKILPTHRNSCFREPPHQCKGYMADAPPVPEHIRNHREGLKGYERDFKMKAMKQQQAHQQNAAAQRRARRNEL